MPDHMLGEHTAALNTGDKCKEEGLQPLSRPNSRNVLLGIAKYSATSALPLPSHSIFLEPRLFLKMEAPRRHVQVEIRNGYSSKSRLVKEIKQAEQQVQHARSAAAAKIDATNARSSANNAIHSAATSRHKLEALPARNDCTDAQFYAAVDKETRHG